MKNIVRKITIKVAMSFVVLAATLASAVYLVSDSAISSQLLLSVILIVSIGAAAVGVNILRSVLLPLRKLAAGSTMVARGNFKSQLYPGPLSKSLFRKSDEMTQAVISFEVMRRKILQLQKDLDAAVKSSRADVYEIKDELAQKEMTLQRSNAMLIGQREELQKINKELALKNAELTESNEKLQKLDKMKSDFILIAAHELRTPIQPILGSIQLAGKGLISTQEAWQSIEEEARRLSNVATYILDVGRIENGTFTYEMKRIELKSLLESVTAASSKFASEDGVISITKLLDDEDVAITGDKERLLQAFGNILGNAVRFAKNGTIAIQTSTKTEAQLVEIKIIDEGPGIPKEILPILFSKFVTKTPENERGTGLGLFITKSIIEAHNGKIRAENNARSGGKGATFTITLPTLPKRTESAPKRASISVS